MSNDALDPAAATAEYGLPDPSDIMAIDSQLTPEELILRQRIRDFTDQQIRPDIADWYDRGIFPLHVAAQLGELGVLGMHLEGYGCPGRSAVEYGLAAMELEAGDSGIRTFVSVQGSLAMSAIHKWGSEDQKQEWLPRMAAGEVIG
ncbi:MAG: acyl-CoA dehydrogenase family protein, partial [Actinomycetota bacterium]|nr:acyl-CoA dehydrogenase family protein [Actinomycetota bacterium]